MLESGDHPRIFKLLIIHCFIFSWRDISNRFQKPAIVEQVHPFQCRALDLIEIFPGAAAPDAVPADQIPVALPVPVLPRGYLLFVFITPSSLEMEFPVFPGRFTPTYASL